MKVIIIILLLFIKYSQLQEITTLFNCTFDYGLVEDCIFQDVISMADQLEIGIGQPLNPDAINQPDRPLSDATSVFSPTIVGEMCQFPYDLNGWEMNFCLYQQGTGDYICPTKSGNQTCAKGQYAYKSTSNPLGFLAIYKSITIIIKNSTDKEHCLSFYYYFTNNIRESTITFRMHSNLNTLNSSNIVIVKPNDENKWYYNHTSFIPNDDEYYLNIVLYRAQDLNDTTNFTFAFDNISIISGSCSYINNDSITTEDNSILTEASTISTDMNTYITKKNTTIQTITSSTTINIQGNTTSTIQTPIMTTTQSFNTSQSTITTMINSTTTKSKNLGLILGLSLGLGIPASIITIAILIYIIKFVLKWPK